MIPFCVVMLPIRYPARFFGFVLLLAFRDCFLKIQPCVITQNVGTFRRFSLPPPAPGSSILSVSFSGYRLFPPQVFALNFHHFLNMCISWTDSYPCVLLCTCSSPHFSNNVSLWSPRVGVVPSLRPQCLVGFEASWVGLRICPRMDGGYHGTAAKPGKGASEPLREGKGGRQGLEGLGEGEG